MTLSLIFYIAELTSLPEPKERKKSRHRSQKPHADTENVHPNGGSVASEPSSNGHVVEQLEPEDSLTGSSSVPVIFNSTGTLLERGQCYKLGDIQFAVTDLTIQCQDTNSVNGAVILNGKIDHSVKIVMPVEKKVQPARPSLDRQDRTFLNKISILNRTVQQELLVSNSTVRRAVRQSMIAAHLRKEVTSALNSKSHNRRFSLGVCSFEHDMDIFNLDLKSMKRVFSYRNENLSELDNLLGSLWDVKETGDGQFRFVTQVVVKLKGYQVTVSVSTAASRLQFSEADYRQKIKSLELSPAEDHLSDCEETIGLDLEES